MHVVMAEPLLPPRCLAAGLSPIVASRRLRGATSGYVVENGSGPGAYPPRVAREVKTFCFAWLSCALLS